MKQYIIKVLLFLILFLIGNYLYLYIIKKIDNGFSKSVEISNFKDMKYDCIILGNSLSLDGIDTEYLTNKGISAYNFGLGGTNLRSNYIQLTHYLSENQKPKFIILGLSSILSNYRSSISDEPLHPIIEHIYGISSITYENLPVIKFKWLASEILKKIALKDHREAKVVLGQLKTKRIVPDRTNYNNRNDSILKYENYKGAIYLFKIDSICKLNNIDIINIEMPGFKNTQNNIPIGPHILNGSNNTFKIYNLNNKKICLELFDSNNDWLGNSHLNEYGALKLTKYINENILK